LTNYVALIPMKSAWFFLQADIQDSTLYLINTPTNAT